MALVDRSVDANMDATTGQLAPQITGLIAGEVIDVAAPCYIAAADGKVYMYDGTAANEKAVFAGFSPRTAQIGQAITLFGYGARFHYGAALAIGTKLYGAATKGRLDTAPTTGGLTALAHVITATDIRVVGVI